MNKTIKVSKKDHGLKIDKALQRSLPEVSRRSIRRSLDLGLVYLNKKLVRFASTVVKAGDSIEITLKAEKKKSKLDIPKDLILYEDDYIIAINKPPFIPSQKTKNPKTPCAKELLLEFLKQKKKNFSHDLILCHRLDKETSGVLVFAKSQEACEWVMNEFKERKCKKLYHALSYGSPKEKSWKQKNYLSSLKNKEQIVRVVRSGGKTAITDFSCLKRKLSPKISLIECRPSTGRTHQIRVQLAHSGLPILGDKKYFSEKTRKKNIFSHELEHHLLHAKILAIKPFKNEKTVEIEAPYAELFEKICKKL